MEYSLAIENTPDTVTGGNGILLVHPSTGETDRIDTDFLRTDTDHYLVISTRTTAREVKQKLEHYEVGDENATVLDTLSAERGYTRRQSDRVRYASAPDDLDAIVEETREFLESHDGKLRVSLDSISEIIYYADEQRTYDAFGDLLDLLDDHDAVGLFHVARGVHDEAVLDKLSGMADGVVELDEHGNVTASL